MRNRAALIALLTLTMLLWATGCGEKEDPKDPPEIERQAVAPAPAKRQADVPPVPEAPPVVEVEAEAGIPEAPAVATTYLGEVLVSWKMGERNEAVRKFVALAWDDPAVLQGIPALAMSETQLALLPETQRNPIVQHAQELAGTLRDLVKEVAAVGDDLAAAGDTRGARAHFGALLRSGQTLKSPNHLLIIQVVGEAMATFAQEKLDAMQ